MHFVLLFYGFLLLCFDGSKYTRVALLINNININNNDSVLASLTTPHCL